MRVLVPYSPDLAGYDLGPSHPLKPERFVLAVELMQAYGMLEGMPPGNGEPIPAARRAAIVAPAPASREDLELVHTSDYIDAVIAASRDPWSFRPSHGLGPGDTPASSGLHEAASLVCGATTMALRAVVEREARHAFSVAGGLHHAHADRAAGFCVYNDPAVAISVLTHEHPGLRVVYVDIDAHHGDGVQEAFYDRDDVLTLSVHESGRYLYPGTGTVLETGEGPGKGFAINLPLPPLADDACYRLALHEVIAPAIHSFAPDVVVAQCGADAHHADPLTHLGLTLIGHRDLVRGIIDAAEESCDGRIVCTGGGGYGTYSVVPRAWTMVLASLLEVDLPEDLPSVWRARCEELSGETAPQGLTEDRFEPMKALLEQARAETAAAVDRVRAASPLLRA